MTIAEMMQLSVLAGREDAAQKLFAYNDLVMEMSGKMGYRTKRVGKNLYYACIKGRIRGILKYARVAL